MVHLREKKTYVPNCTNTYQKNLKQSYLDFKVKFMYQEKKAELNSAIFLQLHKRALRKIQTTY